MVILVTVSCSQIPEAAETPDSRSQKAGVDNGTSAKCISDEQNFLSLFDTNDFVP